MSGNDNLSFEIEESLEEVRAKHKRKFSSKFLISVFSFSCLLFLSTVAEQAREGQKSEAFRTGVMSIFMASVAFAVNQRRKNDILRDENKAMYDILHKNGIGVSDYSTYEKDKAKGMIGSALSVVMAFGTSFIPEYPQNACFSSLLLLGGGEYERKKLLQNRNMLNKVIQRTQEKTY